MKILVLSWEFPPRIVGGIARHVSELYPELVKLGDEIHLITPEFGQAALYELVEGIHVHRVSVSSGNDFLHWVVNLNASIGHYGGELVLSQADFDLVHAHDWLVGDGAIALKERFKIPLIATIHATEHGRYNGIHNSTQSYINDKENSLAYNAWRIVVCSHYMRQEVARVLHSPWDKIDVIYNGIRPEKKRQQQDFYAQGFRRQFAADEEKIVYYLGRMTYEKGIPVLLDAAPSILAKMGGNVKFVFIGGGRTEELKRQAWDLGIWHKCYFTGFLSDEYLDKFQTVADCAVFPSLYEPFGIVALESFASRVPVVVSDTGGFPEVVQHGKTGVITQANNPESLAWGILSVLQNPDYQQHLVDHAYNDLCQRFNWSQLALETQSVYERVIKERSLVKW